MRTETKILEYYKFEELTEKAQRRAIENLYSVNLDYDWWAYVYDDASEIGCSIDEFDTGRGSTCSIKMPDAETTIELILKSHGPTTETYKLALEYKGKVTDSDGYETDEAADFLKALEEEYLCILRREYECLTSEEAIRETIIINEYEFNKEGNFN